MPTKVNTPYKKTSTNNHIPPSTSYVKNDKKREPQQIRSAAPSFTPCLLPPRSSISSDNNITLYHGEIKCFCKIQTFSCGNNKMSFFKILRPRPKRAVSCSFFHPVRQKAFLYISSIDSTVQGLGFPPVHTSAKADSASAGRSSSLTPISCSFSGMPTSFDSCRTASTAAFL